MESTSAKKKYSQMPAGMSHRQLQMKPFGPAKESTKVASPLSTFNLSDMSVVQPKLTIGEPNDKYEKEADQVAHQVVEKINSPAFSHDVQKKDHQGRSGVIRRKDASKSARRKLSIQLKEEDAPESSGLQLESTLRQERGKGKSLDARIKQPMEQAFQADFSGVRIHTGAAADQMNQSIQAKAFATGQDVFFRQGAYAPGSRSGQELLAHELTHVVQQTGTVQAKKIEGFSFSANAGALGKLTQPHNRDFNAIKVAYAKYEACEETEENEKLLKNQLDTICKMATAWISKHGHKNAKKTEDLTRLQAMCYADSVERMNKPIIIEDDDGYVGTMPASNQKVDWDDWDESVAKRNAVLEARKPKSKFAKLRDRAGL